MMSSPRRLCYRDDSMLFFKWSHWKSWYQKHVSSRRAALICPNCHGDGSFLLSLNRNLLELARFSRGFFPCWCLGCSAHTLDPAPLCISPTPCSAPYQLPKSCLPSQAALRDFYKFPDSGHPELYLAWHEGQEVKLNEPDFMQTIYWNKKRALDLCKTAFG